ncbi:anthranilate synthase component 2 [Bacillus oleivorans]|uniref:Anthranilate synthase component 2 n=1 Tax=Bacillus oleivorans TaxID=1448271 RepID=A0A285CLH9_9BACI|nr:aminodeoxychorismate/anthranilate synthase component II [Bacillus oleivorans]SNX68409.1 anthranilate synthase component 2 [Bacillus oleivorans]
MILLIDNYDSFTFNLYQMIAAQAEVVVYRNDEISIEDVCRMNPDGIVISPGPGRPEDAGICVDVIQHFASDVAILGVCLGHQAIGLAFGAEVIQAKYIKHGKRSKIQHQEVGLFTDVPNPVEVMRYHSLVVDPQTLPTELIIIAESIDDQEIMALEHQSYPVYGVQFHPESIGTDKGNMLIKNFLKQCRRTVNHAKVFTETK